MINTTVCIGNGSAQMILSTDILFGSNGHDLQSLYVTGKKKYAVCIKNTAKFESGMAYEVSFKSNGDIDYLFLDGGVIINWKKSYRNKFLYTDFILNSQNEVRKFIWNNFYNQKLHNRLYDMINGIIPSILKHFQKEDRMLVAKGSTVVEITNDLQDGIINKSKYAIPLIIPAGEYSCPYMVLIHKYSDVDKIKIPYLNCYDLCFLVRKRLSYSRFLYLSKEVCKYFIFVKSISKDPNISVISDENLYFMVKYLYMKTHENEYLDILDKFSNILVDDGKHANAVSNDEHEKWDDINISEYVSPFFPDESRASYAVCIRDYIFRGAII